MYASTRAFLDQIIDYAGLFPPAKLPLEDAVKRYLHYRKSSPYAWMLGRFVCPAIRIMELLPLAKPHSDPGAISLTVLGAQSETVEEFFRQLESTIFGIEEFRLAWGNDEVIDTIEIPLTGQAEMERSIYYLDYAAEHFLQAKLTGFVESPMTLAWRDNIARSGQRLDAASRFDSQVGLKLRCGGLTANAFPSDADVAYFIAQCQAARLPWKATAGLHHPRRHWDATLNVWHHGFLNVFGAGVLAWNYALSENDIAPILADRDAEHFRFTESSLAWNDLECTTEQIADARTHFATSFGSCSFDEPCDDLAAMGLI